MIRPLNDWILVHLDPLSEMHGLLYAPSAARVRTATVVDVGPGRAVGMTRAPIGLAPGEKVAFYREVLETKQGGQLVRTLRELEDGLGLVRAPDVLLAFPADARVQIQ